LGANAGGCNGRLLQKRDLIPGHSGIYHLSAGGATSRYEFAKAILQHSKKKSRLLPGWRR